MLGSVLSTLHILIHLAFTATLYDQLTIIATDLELLTVTQLVSDGACIPTQAADSTIALTQYMYCNLGLSVSLSPITVNVSCFHGALSLTTLNIHSTYFKILIDEKKKKTILFIFLPISGQD